MKKRKKETAPKLIPAIYIDSIEVEKKEFMKESIKNNINKISKKN